MWSNFDRLKSEGPIAKLKHALIAKEYYPVVWVGLLKK